MTSYGDHHETSPSLGGCQLRSCRHFRGLLGGPADVESEGKCHLIMPLVANGLGTSLGFLTMKKQRAVCRARILPARGPLCAPYSKPIANRTSKQPECQSIAPPKSASARGWHNRPRKWQALQQPAHRLFAPRPRAPEDPSVATSPGRGDLDLASPSLCGRRARRWQHDEQRRWISARPTQDQGAVFEIRQSPECNGFST